MTDEDITLCEAIYLCIGGKLIDYNLICLFHDKIKIQRWMPMQIG